MKSYFQSALIYLSKTNANLGMSTKTNRTNLFNNQNYVENTPRSNIIEQNLYKS